MNPTKLVAGIVDKPLKSVEVKVEEPSDSEFDSDSDDTLPSQRQLATVSERKAPSNDNDGIAGPIMKARRLDSSSDDSDEDGNDGNDPPYIRDSFFAPDQIVPDQSSVVQSSSEPTSKYRVTETTSIDTCSSRLAAALQLMKEMLPNIRPQSLKPGSLFSLLASMSVVRRPDVLVHRSQGVRLQSQHAFLMQAVGEEVPPDQACWRCSRGHGIMRGVCVVVRHPEVMAATGGACANCWYGRRGSLCSFRSKNVARERSTSEAFQTMPESKPRPESEPKPDEAPASTAPAAPMTSPVAAPIHPAYAASFAPGVINVPLSSLNGASNLAQEGAILWWKTSYRTMSLERLMATHTSLREWQDDLSTRLLAMNAVLLEKLMEREGQP
jgi:hypothetical protein